MAKNKLPWLALLVALVLGLAQTGLAASPGQDTTPPPQSVAGKQPTDDEVNAVAKQLYCPVCENTPLDVCPTQACAEWRDLIRDKLAEGWSESQIKQYFVDRFGDRVLAAPPARGLNWLAYVVPPLAILLGVFLLYNAFKAWRKPLQEEAGGIAPPTSGDEYVDRLEEELRKR
jgi:cytochrome c-type biogenesis protein CcmH